MCITLAVCMKIKANVGLFDNYRVNNKRRLLCQGIISTALTNHKLCEAFRVLKDAKWRSSK